MDRRPYQATVHRVTKSRTRLKQLSMYAGTQEILADTGYERKKKISLSGLLALLLWELSNLTPGGKLGSVMVFESLKYFIYTVFLFVI